MHTIIAGDDPISLQILCRILSRIGSVDVVADCGGAVAAVETALSWGAPPNLVCFDVRVAGLPTRVAVREIRRLENLLALPDAPTMKTLVVTSPREAARPPEPSVEAPDGYVTRPINERQLEQVVKNWGFALTL